MALTNYQIRAMLKDGRNITNWVAEINANRALKSFLDENRKVVHLQGEDWDFLDVKALEVLDSKPYFLTPKEE
jgi:hypothetical protein